jgi:hypothetical protein
MKLRDLLETLIIDQLILIPPSLTELEVSLLCSQDPVKPVLSQLDPIHILIS